MSSETKAEPAGAHSGGSGGGGSSKLIPIVLIVNLLATLGVAGVLVVSFQRESKQESVADIAAGGEHGAEGGEHAAAEGGGEHGAPAEGGHGEAKDAHGAAAGGAHAPEKNPAFGRMVTLEQFTVNLSTPGSATPKFVRVNISIEVPTEEAEGEVTQKMPQVRNTIIDLFNSKRPSDLATAEGRDYLKEEIRNALNGFMVTGKVKGVFFTNFALTT
jgi:flagellar basal body-associated protein FliL